MTVTTAEVEVLTAEVRTLMVGSRQVTLSVYGQLDWIDPGFLVPFGRVRPRKADVNYTQVVGSDSDGVLCRAIVRSGGVDRDHYGRSRFKHPGGGTSTPDISEDELNYQLEVARTYAALPLIVLAGLR